MSKDGEWSWQPVGHMHHVLSHSITDGQCSRGTLHLMSLPKFIAPQWGVEANTACLLALLPNEARLSISATALGMHAFAVQDPSSLQAGS